MNDPHKFEHPTGFATFSDQYRERLFRAAHRITRSHEDAEGAVQDTLLRAFVQMDDFEGRSSFGTWLTRITINSAFMILRKKRTTHEIAMDGSNAFGLDGAAYKIADHAPNPETRCVQTEEQRILRTAIQRLRPKLRVVVQIHLQGRLLEETAEVLGISLSAAKARLFHEAAISATEISAVLSRARMVLISLADSLAGRPPMRPRARAAFRPATVRSRIRFRSNSARAAKTRKTRQPAGETVSICLAQSVGLSTAHFSEMFRK